MPGEGQNPFMDSVKDIEKRTEFAAVSPPLRKFKGEVLEIIDTSEPSISRMHAIIGDLGHGKSHMNHYLYEKAKKRTDVLVSYVSCKKITETKGDKSLFKHLLGELLSDLRLTSPANVQSLIESAQATLNEDKALQEFLKKFNTPKDKWSEGAMKIYDTLLRATELNTDTFFAIMDRVLKDKSVKSSIVRVVFIIDEFELFAEDHNRNNLTQVWAMRETISKYPNIVWVFSCAAKSWQALSEGALTKDMFGKGNITLPHFIPQYDREDRLGIIWSRMLSTIDGYKEEEREEYERTGQMGEYCFPFYDKKNDVGHIMNGGSIAEMIARPSLSPRRMMSICEDYYAAYLQSRVTDSEGDAFSEACSSLFSRHVFDLVNQDKFSALGETLYGIIVSSFRNASRDNFDASLDQLFRIYLSGRTGRNDAIQLRTQQQHLNLVNAFLQKCLGLRLPIDRPQTTRHELLLKVEEELRTRCLVRGYDSATGHEILEFDVNAFQPHGDLPHRSLVFHERLDKITDESGLIPEESMKKVFGDVMNDENGIFSEEAYFRARRDLEEDGRIVSREGGRYEVLQRQKKDLEAIFREEVKRQLKREDTDCQAFYDCLIDENAGFFMPPLVKTGDAWSMKADIPSMNTKGKRIEMQVPVYFWEDVPADAKDRLSKDKFSMVIMAGENGVNKLEDAGIETQVKSKDIFNSHVPADDTLRCVILVASDDEVEDLKWLTWDMYTGHYSAIMHISEETGFRNPLSGIGLRLKRYFNHRLTYVQEQSDLRWDEKEHYGFALKDFGRQKTPQYVSLLGRVLKDGKVECDQKTIALAKDLCGMYPWLKIKNENILCKDKTMCKHRYEGADIDAVTHDLLDLLDLNPVNLDVVSDNFLKKRERKSGIGDNCTDRERAVVRSPAVILLRSLVAAFPDKLTLVEENISKATEASEKHAFDDQLLNLVFHIRRTWGPSNSSTLLDMLSKYPDGKPQPLLKDLSFAHDIHDHLKGGGPKDYLDGTEWSEVDNDKIERHRFLTRAESCARHIIDSIRDEYSELADFDVSDAESKAKGFCGKLDIITEDDGVNDDVRSKVAELRKAVSLVQFEREAKSLKTAVKGIEKSVTSAVKRGKPSSDDLLKIVQSREDLLIDVHEAFMTMGRLTKQLTDIESRMLTGLSMIYHFEASKVLRLLSFLGEIERWTTADDHERMAKVKRDIELAEGPTDYDVKTFRGLSKTMMKVEAAETEAKKIAQERISADFGEGEDGVKSHMKLALRYAEDADGVRDGFKRILDELAERRDMFIKRASEAVDSRSSDNYIRNFKDEAGPQNANFRKKAEELTKKSLSRKYRSILDEATERIKERTLFKWLLQGKSDEGERGLSERLEFLHEMEKAGIITYD